MLLEVVSNFLWTIVTLVAIFVAIIAFYTISDENFRRHRVKAAGFLILYFAISVSCITYLTLTIREKTGEKLLGYAPTYARVMEKMQHHVLSDRTPENDPTYLSLIDIEKIWLSANKFISDIYTMKMNPDGKFYLMVDSETDYDRNGKFEGEREQRTTLGEVYEKDYENLKLALEGNEVFTGRVVHDRWGNWVSAYVPLRTKEGKVDGVLGVDFDSELYLADQRRMIFLSGLFFEALLGFLLLLAKSRYKELSTKEALTQALKISEEAKETKSRFIATISHEIRTPLNGISGAVELLGLNPSSAESKSYFKIIQTCSSQLLDLVNDVLDFSKIESDKVVLEKIHFNLFELLHSTLEIVQLKAKEKNLALIGDLESLRDFTFEGDPIRIRQIVTNLLSNAVKFTAKGNVTLAARFRGFPENGEVEVSVADTGEGISAENQKKLFQSFSQVDASTTRKFGGTGLGLAISRALAELMGGSLLLESQINKGSIFKLRIPARRVADTCDKEAQQPKLPQSLTSLTKYKILVTDDNIVNRQLLVKYLEKLGHSCRQATNGKEALDFLNEEEHDLVFMDGQMPVLDGYESAKLIQEKYKDSNKKPKIIAITANGDSEDRLRFLRNGADAFLLKPATLKQIEAVIAKIMPPVSAERKKVA